MDAVKGLVLAVVLDAAAAAVAAEKSHAVRGFVGLKTSQDPRRNHVDSDHK